MNTLDDLNKIKKFDSQGMHQSIESLGLQCQQAWEEVKAINIPKSYRQVDNILINGMGGSALGGHIISALFNPELPLPLRVINDYVLPGYVSQRTLYIISSYSGNTEEPLATFQMARRLKAKILVIGSGGKLARLAKKHKLPGYIFTPRFNPCGQPRMGLGYSIFGQLALLEKVGLIKVTERELSQTIESIVRFHGVYGLKVKFQNNKAKQAAQSLRGKIPIIVSAGHLAGNAHIFANQINENSKNFSAYFLISELNHHLMEGLLFPKTNRHVLTFLFIESSGYPPKIQKRFLITKKVLKKNHIPCLSYQTQSQSALAQMMEALLFGSYVNFYLAMLNKVNPSLIPFVDFFKHELEK